MHGRDALFFFVSKTLQRYHKTFYIFGNERRLTTAKAIDS